MDIYAGRPRYYIPSDNLYQIVLSESQFSIYWNWLQELRRNGNYEEGHRQQEIKKLIELLYTLIDIPDVQRVILSGLKITSVYVGSGFGGDGRYLRATDEDRGISVYIDSEKDLNEETWKT